MYSQWFPSRLKEAREARGWSLSDLGDLIGKSRQAISQFENDQAHPAPEVFIELVRQLDVPARFFDQPPTEVDLNPVFYRRLKSTRQRDLSMAERRLAWLQHTVGCMERYVEFPAVDVPSLQVKSDPNDISDDDIENAAMELREKWALGNGAISSVLRLLEHHGCIVVRDALGVHAIDAFSQWQFKKHRPIIALSRDDEGIFYREQMSAAHELGHILLHRNIDKRFTATAGNVHDLIERQANRFAGAFLLPRLTFQRSVRTVTLDSLYLLKIDWIVSIGVMIRRCQDLGMIDAERTTALWKQRTKRGWNRREPLDDTMPSEMPEMLGQGVRLLSDSGHLLEWINEVCLSLNDIAQFVSVEVDMLRPPSPETRLRALPPRTQS